MNNDDKKAPEETEPVYVIEISAENEDWLHEVRRKRMSMAAEQDTTTEHNE